MAAVFFSFYDGGTSGNTKYISRCYTIDAMEFKKVFTAILLELEKCEIPYTIIGAMALGFWGIQRATIDIDFLVKAADREKIVSLMKRFGYDHAVSGNFADQFSHVVKEMGFVDFLYTNKEKGIIETSRSFKGPDDTEVCVALPEDLIALKLDAVRNNPKREFQDWADIQAVVELLGDTLDWNKIREYCSILDMEAAYEKILNLK